MSLRMFGRATAVGGCTRRQLNRLASVAVLGLAALGVAGQATAGNVFTGQFGAGSTWNLYEVINTPFTFKDAIAFAEGRANPIDGNAAVGHLFTIADVTENNTIHAAAGGGGDRIEHPASTASGRGG